MTLDRTRAGYAAIGIVILLMLPPLILRAQRHLAPKIYESEHPGRYVAQLIATRLLVLTATFGANYLLGRLVDPQGGQSLLLPGAALLLAVLSIPWQVRHAYRMRASASHPANRPDLSAPRLTVAKLILLFAALLAQLLLERYIPHSAAVVAVAIVVAPPGRTAG
ncbi:hypothetical protein [Streptomyces sp. bgisy084]|uniref:hypothetical protein n=1 Tax=unclassified Streptomyces TaxID=2593676 RepID=UPI003D728C62